MTNTFATIIATISFIVSFIRSFFVKTKQVTITRFVFDESGNAVTPVMVKIDQSRQLKGILAVKDCKFLNGDVEIVARGDNNNVVEIDVSKIKDVDVAANRLVAEYYMRGKGAAMRFYIKTPSYKKLGAFSLKPLFGNGKEIAYRDSLPGFCRFGGKNGGQIATEGGKKAGVLTLVNNNNAAKIQKHMDTLDFGSLSYHIGESMPIDKMAKKATRYANWMAVGIADEGPSVENFAIYFGEFGQGNLDGMSFTTLIRRGNAVQNRAYMCKTLSLGVNAHEMKVFVSAIDADPIVIKRSDIDDDLNEELRRAVDTKGKGTRFAGRIVIICENVGNDVEYFADMNALKESFDFRRISNLNVVKTFGSERSKVTLSSQILTKMLFQNPDKAKALFKEQHVNALADAFKFKAVEATAENLSDPGRYINAIVGLDPNAIQKYGWLFKRLVDQTLLGDREALNKFRAPIAGSHKVLIGDLAAMFGAKLLNANEVYSNGLKPVVEYTSIKFPSQDAREYANVRNISDPILDRIADKVNNGDLTQEQGAVLHDLLQVLGSAIVMISAAPIVKARQAGLDFDGDCATFIKTSLLGFHQQPVAVKIVPPQYQNNGETAVVGYDVMAQAMARIWKLQNASVGAVTNAFTAIQYMELDHDVKAFRNLLRKVFGNYGNGTAVYQPIFAIDGHEDGVPFVVVSESKIQNVFRQLKTMSLSEDNVMNAIRDINRGMGRWYQEVTIDAVKKFFDVFLPEGFIEELSSKKSDVAVVIDWQNGTPKNTAEHRYSGIRRHLQDSMVADTMRLAKEAADKVMKVADIGDDVVKNCVDIYTNVPTDVKASIGVLCRQMMEASRAYAETQDSTAYETTMAGIENQLRMVLHDVDPSMRVVALLGYAFNTPKMRTSIIRKLGVSVFREEFAHFVAWNSGNPDSIDAVRDIETSFDPSKMVIRLQNRNSALVADIKNRLDAEDSVVSLVRKGDNVLLAINGAVIKGAFVDCGRYGSASATMLTKIYSRRVGKVGSTILLNNEAGFGSTLIATLYDVQKVAVDATAAH